MANRMYFGTQAHMRWIKCPNSGLGMSRVGWAASGTYLNGGGWSRASGTSHAEPSLTWSFLNHIEAREILDFYYGAHGAGPFYWLDPFAMATNVLPVHWSIPCLAADDAPSLIWSRRPALSTTVGNTIGLPSGTATYEFKTGDVFDTLWVPVPENFTFHIAAWGSASGTAALVVDSADIGLTPPSISSPTWTSVSGVTGVTLSASGVGGLSLAGVVAQVRPDGEEPSAVQFLSGAGHSGCMFKGPPVPVGYSAPHALDYQSLTADFIEVGAWLS